MNISPVEYYNDISTWNANTQALPSDPNTLPATPPHTHLHHSQADMSNTWDEPPAAENAWPSSSMAQDAAIAGELQVQELGEAFAGIDIERGGKPERGPPPPRRPREYGISTHPTISISSPFYPILFIEGCPGGMDNDMTNLDSSDGRTGSRAHNDC